MKSFLVIANMVIMFILLSGELKSQQLDQSFGNNGLTDTFNHLNGGLSTIYRGSTVVNHEGKIFYQRNLAGNVIVDSNGQIINSNWKDGNHLLSIPGNKMCFTSDSIDNFQSNYGCLVTALDSTGQQLYRKLIPFDSTITPSPNLTYDIASLSDSSMLITVCFYGMGWDSNTYVCKMRSNGDMDSSFGHYGVLRYPTKYPGGFYSRYLSGSVTGMFTNLPIVTDIYDNFYVGVFNVNQCNSVLKYNKYGIADSNFNANTNVWSTSVTDRPSRLLIDYQGNIVIIGSGSSITRINSMGNLDTTFNGSGFIQGTGSNWSDGYFVDALIQADNKIMMIRNEVSPSTILGNRLHHNGTLDTSWQLEYIYYCDPSHPSLINRAIALAIQPDGKLIMPFIFQANSWCNGPIGGSTSMIARFHNNQCGNGNSPASLTQPTCNNLIVCSGQQATIKLNGNLNGASLWKYYTNWDTTLQVIYADSLKVYPSQTTTYYFKGVGACVTDGPLDSLTISVLPTSSYSIYETACDSFYFNGQSLITSGVYYDTLTNQYGCDSLVTLNLTINTSNGSVMNETACNTFYFNGQSLTTSGVYYDTLTNQSGCDSLVTLNLTINSSNGSVMNETACNTFFFNGQSLTSSGIYYDTLINQSGCDSLVTLNLTINTSNGSVMNETACNSFYFNGQSLTTSGVYYDTLTNQYGCDSLVTLNITINSSYGSVMNETACNTFFFNGQSLTSSGIYYDTLINQYGCDSLVTLNLTINSSNGSVMNETACDTFFFNGQSLTTSGVYYDTLTNQYGCDSLVTLNLTINTSNGSVMNETACNTFFFNGQSLTSSGIYYDTLINQSGCDSLVILNLTINSSNGSVMNETACNSFYFNGQSLTTSGVYYDTLINQFGCDSIIALNLSVVNIDTTVTQIGFLLNANVANASYQWLQCNPYAIISGANGQNYSAITNGDYAVEISQNGCTDTSNCITVLSVGLNNLDGNNTIQLIPNPAHDFLEVRSESGDLKNADIKMYNAIGQLVYSSLASHPKSNISNLKSNISIDISSFSNGIYFVEIKRDGKVERMRILKN